MKLKSINPSNYEMLGEVEVSTEMEIKKAVERARKAQENWQEIGVEKRIKYLKKLYQVFENNQKEYAELASAEMGMPISQSSGDWGEGLKYFRWYLENAEKVLSPKIVLNTQDSVHTVYREPYGVAAVIVPWNYPISTTIWLLIPNLLAGNTVVYKNSKEIPLCGNKLDEYVAKAGIPDGVFNQVYGDGKVGDLLVHQDIDLISFTGSTKTGQYLYKVAAEKMIRVVLEMGGSAPGIVFEDASTNDVVQAVDYNRYGNTGQICDGLKRLIVHESRFEEVLRALKTLVENKVIGEALDPKTEIGPLVSKRQLELLEVQVKDAVDKGAKMVTGGKRPPGRVGAYFEPTILTGIKRDMKVWQEEVFGPVLPIATFKTEVEAIELANDTKYGLGGYLFTKNEKRNERVVSQIKTGMISVNGVSYLEPTDPFGGYKMSGIGREHGRFGLEDLTQVKVVARPK